MILKRASTIGSRYALRNSGMILDSSGDTDLPETPLLTGNKWEHDGEKEVDGNGQ